MSTKDRWNGFSLFDESEGCIGCGTVERRDKRETGGAQGRTDPRLRSVSMLMASLGESRYEKELFDPAPPANRDFSSCRFNFIGGIIR